MSLLNVIRTTRLRFAAVLLLGFGLTYSVPSYPNVTEWMSVDAFLQSAFPEADHEAQVLWLTPDLREEIEEALNRNYSGLRIRYWANDSRTAWILEQIGKERPITAGFVVEGGQLVETHVLVYRESRGGEIRYQSFRDQFSGAVLKAEKLDRHIDGISGATLSVRSMTQMAKAALILDNRSNSEPIEE